MTRRLIIRLSSLGDVILATSALEALQRRGEPPVDWVTSREYVSLLQGHPMIRRVIAFDRKSGLDGWGSLSRELWNEKYDEILDLHDTLRSRMLQRWFSGYAQQNPMQARPRWIRFPKQRGRFAGLTAIRSLWPKGLTPEPYVKRFAVSAGGSGEERPDLTHLLVPGSGGGAETGDDALLGELREREYVCVMPSSKWKGKQWPAANYVSVFRHLRWTPVVLGMPGDACSREVAEGFARSGIKHVSAIGKWDLRQTARVLALSRGIVGCDTGLLHLAEAVGSPALMILGPTTERVGFGPWRRESQVVGADLWCRPCGKDGRACFRVVNRHLCMSRVSPSQVIQSGRKLFGDPPNPELESAL